MTKEEAHRIIDAERDYQDERYPEERTIGEELLLLHNFVEQAIYTYSYNRDHSLEFVREIAALAQRTIEHHGAPERQRRREWETEAEGDEDRF